uniref:Uncharacterized protein n=1 Tax=Anopheles melas TaxID=34690 RepID=A0A182TXS9_9DIPT
MEARSFDTRIVVVVVMLLDNRPSLITCTPCPPVTTTPGCCWCCCWSSSSPSSPGCARDTICILASIRSGSSDVRRSVRGGGDGCRDDADGDSGPPRSPRASLSVFFGGRCEMGRCWSVAAAEDEDDGDDAAGLEPSPGRAPYTMHWFSPSTNVRTSGAVPAAFLSSGASCCPDRQPSFPSSRDLRSACSPRSPCASASPHAGVSFAHLAIS